jgi:hypothetical protein
MFFTEHANAIELGVTLFVCFYVLALISVAIGIWIGKLVIRVIEDHALCDRWHHVNRRIAAQGKHGNTKAISSRGGNTVPE